MRFGDLFLISTGNLKRRKTRTILTVLGVMIGTASVVIMLSLGIGLDALTTEMYEKSGSMTEITVYPSSQTKSGAETGAKQLYLTDKILEDLKKLPHVKSVSPYLSTNVIIKQGQWILNTSLVGVSRAYLNDIPLSGGKKYGNASNGLSLIYGNMVLTQFTNEKTGKGYYDNNILPDVNFTGSPLFVVFDTEAYFNSKNPAGGASQNPGGMGNTSSGGASGDTGAPVKAPKKYLLPAEGVVEGGIEDYNQYGYSVYCDVDLLKPMLKKIYHGRTIPGQPTNKKGKPYAYFCYDQAIVSADNMKNVTALQKEITDLGYQANSNMEWLEQSKKQSKIIQAVLGGIGAVALLVAAIGIANTMMMSIYERTREIGIMKVLGCDMKRIRDMFLIESGLIGLIGGVVGLIISCIASFVLNSLGAAKGMMGIEGDISRIPVWLAGAAVLFAVFVGMASGFLPAKRAMKLSPLSALRNE